MAETLAQLLTVKTREDFEQLLINEAVAQGFPMTDLNPGSVYRTFLKMLSAALEQESALIPEVTKGGFLMLAQTSWLTFLAANNYETDRFLSTFARHSVTLTDTGGGPYTIVVGQLIATTASGKRFRNVTGGVLPFNGLLVLTFEAESPGTSYNVSTNAIDDLATPLPGVDATASVLTISATDEETDTELRSRTSGLFPLLGQGLNADAWSTLVKNLNANIRRVKVTPNLGTGEVNIVIARQDTTATVGDVADLSTGGANDLAQYAPSAVQPLVSAAIEFLQSITATIFVLAGQEAEAQAQVIAEIADLIRSVPIEGTLFLSNIIEVLERPSGVTHSVLTIPAANVVLPLNTMVRQNVVTIIVVTV